MAPHPHVLHIFQPNVGGVPAYVANLTRGLVGHGWRVSIAAPADAERLDEMRQLGVQVIELDVRRAPHPLTDARAIHHLCAFARRQGVGVIHGHSSKGSVLAGLVGARAGVPSVYTPHGWSFLMRVPLPLGAAFALTERHLLHHYHHAAVAVSVAERVAAQRWHVDPEDRVVVIRTGLPPAPTNGLTRDAARARLGIRDDRFTVAWVGRLHRAKRPQDVAPIARLAGPEVRLLVLGHGLRGTPHDSALRGAGGVLAPAGTPPQVLLTAADAFLLTSEWEGLPLAVLEAMHAGLPIVSYDVGGVPEQVVDRANGFLVAVGDRAAAAERLRRLAAHREEARAFGAVSRQRVEALFSYDDMLADVQDLYRCALAGTRPQFRSRPPWAPPPNSAWPAADAQPASPQHPAA